MKRKRRTKVYDQLHRINEASDEKDTASNKSSSIADGSRAGTMHNCSTIVTSVATPNGIIGSSPVAINSRTPPIVASPAGSKSAELAGIRLFLLISLEDEHQPECRPCCNDYCTLY